VVVHTMSDLLSDRLFFFVFFWPDSRIMLESSCLSFRAHPDRHLMTLATATAASTAWPMGVQQFDSGISLVDSLWLQCQCRASVMPVPHGGAVRLLPRKSWAKVTCTFFLDFFGMLILPLTQHNDPILCRSTMAIPRGDAGSVLAPDAGISGGVSRQPRGAAHSVWFLPNIPLVSARARIRPRAAGGGRRWHSVAAELWWLWCADSAHKAAGGGSARSSGGALCTIPAHQPWLEANLTLDHVHLKVRQVVVADVLGGSFKTVAVDRSTDDSISAIWKPGS
jgi:hypothetical protein